jgi:hypothetical protein
MRRPYRPLTADDSGVGKLGAASIDRVRIIRRRALAGISLAVTAVALLFALAIALNANEQHWPPG